MSGSHNHSHAAGHHRGHSHGPTDYNRAFAIGVALNVGFVAVEAVYGVLAHSVALLADAGHNLTDVLSLLIAWGAASLSRARPTLRRTYGYRRSSIRSEEHTSELQSLMRNSYAVFCLKKKTTPSSYR